MAAVPELARRWPVRLNGPFQATVDFPAIGGEQDSKPQVSLYFTDARWRTHEAPAAGGVRGAATAARRVSLSINPDGADDLIELGVAIRWGSRQPPAGSVSISIDRLVLQASARHDPPLPPEGDRLAGQAGSRRWRIDDSYGGVEALTQEGGATRLQCNLDWQDRRGRSGVVWVDVREGGSPIDMSERGVFVTLHCRQTLTGAPLIGFRASTGLRDADGNVFWGKGCEVVADGLPATAGAYPETRFPLPQGFCGLDFDPARVVEAGLRLDVIDDKRRVFAGGVSINDLRVVAMPAEVRTERDRIANRLGRANWLGALAARAPGTQAAALPIAEFRRNVGVNYPWPPGRYPSVGRRAWNAEEGGFSACVEQVVQDFEYLASHGVRLVRVFLFCDGRTGIVDDGRGGLALDAFVLPDVRALLAAVEKFESLRLAPVLFDFLIADGVEREDFALVGEHADWLADAGKRGALLDAVQPVIDVLCAHPQVAFIDLMNEPEHAAAVGADDMWAFLAQLAERVHRHPRRMRCTVGSANALYAPFWLSTGIDFPTCHWFEKIDASHALGQHAPALNPHVTLMTEIDPGVGVAAALARLRQAGFGGGLFWSLNAGDAYEFRGGPAEALKRVHASGP